MRRFRMKGIKPTRIGDMSPSEFKTMLKRLGHKVHREFYVRGCVSQYKNRFYRWRHRGDHYTNDLTFVVDISCLKSEFDRWANSVDKIVTFESREWTVDEQS